MSAISIRPGRLNGPAESGQDDAETLLALIRGLALYENEPHAVKATVEDLRRHGGGQHPRFETLIAELDGKPAGFALYFHNYSTWTGKPGLYLEDLFVEEWARGYGLGRKLMTRCARIAHERGCGRFDLWVLHWNKTREFYHRLGLRHMEEWLPYRADTSALAKMAAEDDA